MVAKPMKNWELQSL